MPSNFDPPPSEPPDALLRLFVAIPLEASLRARLREAAKPLERLGAKVSWSRPESMHLTLVFLGDVFAARIPVWRRALDAAVAGIPSFSLTFAGLGVFGRPRAPRVVWAGIPAPPEALFTLRQEIAGALRAEGAVFEKRPFHPHVTLGRVRSSRGAAPLAEALAALRDAPPRRFGRCAVDRVALIQSTLTPQGPRYRSRHLARLGDNPGPTKPDR